MHHLRRAMQYRQPLAQNGYAPLSDFYKIWFGEGVPGLHPHAKFHHCSFKNVGLQPQIAKISIFCINLPKRGISP